MLKKIVFIIVAFAVLSCARQFGSYPTLQDELRFIGEISEYGLWNESFFRLSRLYSLYPDNPEIANNLAVACEALGKYKQAELLYRKALSIDPNNRYIKENYERFKRIRKGEDKDNNN